MEAGAKVFLVPYIREATKQDISLYQSIIGSLNYLAIHTRADIAFATSALARYLCNPSPQHIKAARRVLKYLQGTIILAVIFRGEDALLACFSDSDFAEDIDTRRSTSGYVIVFAGGIICWSSKRQSLVATSTMEAKYYAMKEAG